MYVAEIYGASVSKETISRIADVVLAEMQDWSSRPLDRVHAAIFIDAVVVKIRDGQVVDRPVHAAIGVTLDGHKDVLGSGVPRHRVAMSGVAGRLGRGGREILDVGADRPA